MDYFEELKQKMKGLSRREFDLLKVRLAQKHGLKDVPPNHELVLRGINVFAKPSRTSSGVSVIALMSAPFPCPHGKCIFCPGGVDSAYGTVPQSYLGNEPSTLRGIRNEFDSYLIAFNRLEQYFTNGHCPEKIECVVQGGTFLAYPKEYQEEFITNFYKALNDFSEKFYNGLLDIKEFKAFFELPTDFKDAARCARIMDREKAMKGCSTLEKEKIRNEKASIRCVALAIETRPDWCFEKHIDEMLRFGATRVELGVQCLNDDVLEFCHRGHNLADLKKASRLMKNALLKHGYHMMPGLPGMSKEEDIETFRELFENPDYMPDSLKIYPCMIFKGTGLYELYKKGKFIPLEAEAAADIIVEAKKFVPKWCRVMRVQRDIPEKYVEAGVKMTNLRQLVHRKMGKKGCKCIRCREPKDKDIDWDHVELKRVDYESSGGKEVFLSFEDAKNDLLLGFCRLRIVPESHRPEISPGDAGIRELHVYGAATPLGKEGSIQHRGLGKKLVAEAEKIAKEEFGSKKMIIISGVGVREYYRNLGYEKDGPYMSKKI
ncbi:tRNA uridine(34) 5-carboxymethylaminomethyl modification radical SAM/GNAT enzyme Elp3 [Candidatus Woesearchaeota archaeon]|nr:tRNA uridine(34) 5-carboxymethylaminomethyl modification radical SAM/GNAT enzyme Elp3 [Candidatus Woesearchaeota archaeon]